ncbi:MAG: hypothetical protein AAF267_14445 [Deinococcota bacterium]
MVYGKHITLAQSTHDFLVDYQHRAGLSNFSATIEAAVDALKKQSRIEGYQQFAADYQVSTKMQQEAEAWLDAPLEEHPPARS